MNGPFTIGDLTATRYFFSIAVLLGLLFALIATEDGEPAGLVFLRWQLQAIIPMALMVGTHRLLSAHAYFVNLNPWVALSLSGFIGASLFAPVALLIDLWLEPEVPPDLSAEFFDEWLSVVPPVVLCWLGINAPWVLGFRLEKPTADKKPAPQPDSSAKVETTTPIEPAGFTLLLPPDKRGKLILLKAELHYLQVVTDAGSTLILYNLSDAVRQLPPHKGMMVHRSYWVAVDAVAKLVRRGRQGELHLHDGRTVPVSRSRLQEVSGRLSGERH